MELVPKIIIPRREVGVDHGADLFVLARRGSKELRWWYGHKVWHGITQGYQYEPASLLLIDTKQHIMGTELHDKGGRLSKALLMAHQTAIDAFFGVTGVAAACNVTKTLLID